MTKKVLIAEDEDDLRNLVKIYLEPYDVEVLEASDGEEAVEFAKKHKPDMVITDNNMPGLTGYEVLQKLKGATETRNIPVVMVTGKKFDQEMQMLIKFDAADFIQKPYEEDKIVAVVKKVLGDIKKKSEVDSVVQEVSPKLVEESFVSEEKNILEQDVVQQFVEHIEQQVSLKKETEQQTETQVTEEQQFSVPQPIEEKNVVEQPVSVEEKDSVVEQPSLEVGQTVSEDVPLVDNTQRLEYTNVEQTSATEDGIQVEEPKVFLEDSKQKDFVEQDKVQEQESETVVLQEVQKISSDTNFSGQSSVEQGEQENLEPSLDTTLLPPDFSVISQEVVVEEQILQQTVLQESRENVSIDSQGTVIPVVENVEPVMEQHSEEVENLSEQGLQEQKEVVVEEKISQQTVLQESRENVSIDSQGTVVSVVENVEPVVEKQREEVENLSEQGLQEQQKQKEIEKIVLPDSNEQQISKSQEPETEKVAIPEISQNLKSVSKEKIPEAEEKLHILDEGIYLVSKLVATSVLETLFPQKKVKPTLESKAIVLIIENIVSRDTISKLNHIIETIPLMKVMINQELFNEKIEKIKSFIKKVSKEEVFQLSDALSKFFKK
ncbi:MAG: response regulator [Endomicrobiia bacterium]